MQLVFLLPPADVQLGVQQNTSGGFGAFWKWIRIACRSSLVYNDCKTLRQNSTVAVDLVIQREAKLWQNTLKPLLIKSRDLRLAIFKLLSQLKRSEILSIYNLSNMHPSIFIVENFFARFACRSWTLIISKSTKTLGNGMPRSSEGLMDMTGLEAARFVAQLGRLQKSCELPEYGNMISMISMQNLMQNLSY